MTNATHRIYDGDECVADTDADGNPLRSYVWGPGIDNLLAVTVYTNNGATSVRAKQGRN
ncbi:MAG: hypothetical protein PHV28_10155 [Kiritimatiellae bacterium]|nr:hypothetical protein [Kiritimatiellia bacterium]